MEIYKVTMRDKYDSIVYSKNFKNPFTKPDIVIHLYQVCIEDISSSECPYKTYYCFVIDKVTKKEIFEFFLDVYGDISWSCDIYVNPRQHKSFIKLHELVEFIIKKCIKPNRFKLIFYTGRLTDVGLSIYKQDNNTILLVCYHEDYKIAEVELTKEYKNRVKLFDSKDDIHIMDMVEQEYVYYINIFGKITISDEYVDNKEAILLLNRYNHIIQKCFKYIQFNPLDYDIV